MSKLKKVQEKLDYCHYDCFFVRDGTFEDAMMDPGVIRFFVDVQSKTKLETNMQAAGQLPSLNTFEVRAMRVAASSVRKRKDEKDPVPAADFLEGLIYNSVTSLIVGEKTMIENPTFMFPAGAGVSPGNGNSASHGEPDPLATFRFAEPVVIESLQNFRVELQFPRALPDAVSKALGPLRIWVVLHGYLTRDVQ